MRYCLSIVMMFNLNFYFMSKQPDLMPEHQAHLPRTGHDLGHSNGFTATSAHLLPVFHTILNAGEKITLGLDYNIRTMPLQQAAMAEIKVHTEYFFVPFNLIYEPLASYLMSVNDNYSSNFIGYNHGLPLLDMATVGRLVTTNRNTEQYGVMYDRLGRSASRLFDMLDLPIMISDNPKDDNNDWIPLMGNIFPYQLLSYQAIYQYYYRLDSREKFDNSTFNWDRFFNDQGDIAGASEADIYKLIKLQQRPRRDDYFSSVKVSPLVDMLNLNIGTTDSLRLAQNWLSRGSVGSSVLLNSGSQGNSTDWYTGSPTRGNNGDPASAIQTQFGMSNKNMPSPLSSNPSYVSPNGLDITTSNIRALFANEKLWSITGRAKKTYDDQVLAHFGYHVPHDVKHQISCFGHDTTDIRIGEVISTAATSDAPLAEIAGKGYGSQSNQRHSFTAPCHGCVMVIFSIEPLYRYYYGLGRWNQIVDYNDFYTPEYDHLGMQPMFAYEQGYYDRVLESRKNRIVGWEFRYEQFKRRPPKVSYAFANLNGSLNSWMLGKSPYVQGIDSYVPNTDTHAYYMYRPFDLNQIFLGQYSTSYPTSPGENIRPCFAIYDNDPFVVDSYVYAKLVSTMSSYSLPHLDA